VGRLAYLETNSRERCAARPFRSAVGFKGEWCWSGSGALSDKITDLSIHNLITNQAVLSMVESGRLRYNLLLVHARLIIV